MGATITIGIEELDKLGLGEDIKNLIVDRVKDRVAFEVSNLRPVITVQISQMLHGELMSMTRDVLKSDEMQEAIKGIALGVAAGFVKKRVESITETLYAELRETKDA